MVDILFAVAWELWHKSRFIVRCRAKQSSSTYNTACLSFPSLSLRVLCSGVPEVQFDGHIRPRLRLAQWTNAANLKPYRDIDNTVSFSYLHNRFSQRKLTFSQCKVKSHRTLTQNIQCSYHHKIFETFAEANITTIAI